MSIGRVGRSPLGAAYRSPLGVLTRVGQSLPYVMVVSEKLYTRYFDGPPPPSPLGTKYWPPSGSLTWDDDFTSWNAIFDDGVFSDYCAGVAVLDVEWPWVSPDPPDGSTAVFNPPFFPSVSFTDDDIVAAPQNVNVFDVPRLPTLGNYKTAFEESTSVLPGTAYIDFLIESSSFSPVTEYASDSAAFIEFKQWLEGRGVEVITGSASSLWLENLVIRVSAFKAAQEA